MLEREMLSERERGSIGVPSSIERCYRIALRTRNILLGCVATGSVWLGLAIAWQLLISTRLQQTPTAALVLPVVLILGPVFWAVAALIARHAEQVEAQIALAHERSRMIRADHDSRIHLGGRRRTVETPSETVRLPAASLFEEVPTRGRVGSYVPLPEEFGVEDLSIGSMPDPRDDLMALKRPR